MSDSGLARFHLVVRWYKDENGEVDFELLEDNYFPINLDYLKDEDRYDPQSYIADIFRDIGISQLMNDYCLWTDILKKYSGEIQSRDDGVVVLLGTSKVVSEKSWDHYSGFEYDEYPEFDEVEFHFFNQDRSDRLTSICLEKWNTQDTKGEDQ